MQNGTTNIDTLADNLQHVAEYLASHAESMKSSAPEAPSFLARVGKVIKAHPIAAVGIAFGIGYLAVRIIRR